MSNGTKYPEQYWHCKARLGKHDEQVKAYDLTFSKLKSSLVQPWRKENASFVIGGVVAKSKDDVHSIQIVHTDHPSSHYAEEFKRRYQGKALIIDAKAHVFSDDVGKDYTSELLYEDAIEASVTTGAKTESSLVESPSTVHDAIARTTRRKFQVFVSSTYEDLKEERNAVYQTLLKSDCIPCGMELFSASNESQWETITEAINLCDYYILILASRYGSIDKPSGQSYTEKEYRYALSQNIPVASLVISKDAHWPESRRDKSETGGFTQYELQKKLDEFKSFASQSKMIAYWENKQDLQLKCKEAIETLKAKNPRPGWIRGDAPNLRSTEAPPVMAESEEERRARESILVGALSENGRLYLVEGELNVGSYTYNDSVFQMALYKQVFDKLLKEGLIEHERNALYKLTYRGLLDADELKKRGVSQDMPNP